jgi:hypothetical protein
VLLLCGRQHDRFTAIDACGAPCPVTFPQKDFERVRGRSKAIRFHGIKEQELRSSSCAPQNLNKNSIPLE